MSRAHRAIAIRTCPREPARRRGHANRSFHSQAPNRTSGVPSPTRKPTNAIANSHDLLRKGHLLRIRDKKRGLYAGFATSAGIVLGLLLLRTAFASGYSLAAEFLANRLTYIYVFVATALVFIVLGYRLGREADELRRLSMTDALTGLPNRHAFQARLRDEWRRSRRYRAPLALLLIDVDGLKPVNDEQGHEAGDRVLREVAGAIRHTLRGTDIGARWGGDEFAIIAPNTGPTAADRPPSLGREPRAERESPVTLARPVLVHRAQPIECARAAG